MICGLLLAGCSRQSAGNLSGIWRAEDNVAAKNLVIEFVPDGTGTVFSGSIIGLPADAPIQWRVDGDQIHIETKTDEATAQTLALQSQSENELVISVNRSELTLVRVDNLMDEDAIDSLP